VKKKDLIKLALIGLTSSACIAAKGSDELDQALSMYRRDSGHKCKGNKGKCRSQKKGAKTEDSYKSNSDKNSCSGPGGCGGTSDEDMNKNSCSGKGGCSSNGCNSMKNKNSCKGNGKCSSKSDCSGSKCPGGNCQKNADRNAKKRYDSSY